MHSIGRFEYQKTRLPFSPAEVTIYNPLPSVSLTTAPSVSLTTGNTRHGELVADECVKGKITIAIPLLRKVVHFQEVVLWKQFP